MTYTKAEPIKRYCKSKQVMCELANELGYCKITACANLSSFPKIYTTYRAHFKGGNEQMTKEEAIKILIESKDESIVRSWSEWDEYDKKLYQAIDMAIEALKVEAMQKWVPCSERLPEVGETCLLTVHEYGWNCKDYTRVIIGEYSDNYADHILAWMPLPTPYRERSEE